MYFEQLVKQFPCVKFDFSHGSVGIRITICVFSLRILWCQ